MIYDAIVIGLGSMGSATCYQLARKGLSVLGIEQFESPHDFGSHSGQTRLIRKAYGEHPDYVPLLERAYENWAVLGKETSSQIYFPTGLAYFGPETDDFMKTVQFSSEEYKIPLERMSHQQCQHSYPQFHLSEDTTRLFEPDAGFLLCDTAIELHIAEAQRYGAAIQSNEQVLQWKYIDGLVRIYTNRGEYRSKKLVISVGAWAPDIIPAHQNQLEVTRQILVWFEPKRQEDFMIGNFPCWFMKKKELAFYGFPILPQTQFGGEAGLKVAIHFPGEEVVNPNQVNRNIDNEELEVLLAFMKKHLPDGFGKILNTKVCLYTNTPDEHFILDFLPDTNNQIAVATGFSGHGFKFASVIGEIMSDLVTNGHTDLPIDFLRIARFQHLGT